jgi:CRISPR-associated protein Csb2
VVRALDTLAARVQRLGHSSSFVSTRFFVAQQVELGERYRWLPDANGDETFRTTLPDQLERLEEAYERHLGVEPRVLPAAFTRYRNASEQSGPTPIRGSLFDHRFIVFEVVPETSDGRRLLLDNSLTQQVTRAMRGLLLKSHDGELPPSLSGHDENGTPSKQPHLAISTLSDVGHPYATGTILGVALVLPRGLSDENRRLLLQLIDKTEKGFGKVTDPDEPPALPLTLGSRGVLYVRRVRGEPDRTTLHASTWTRPARRWDSVTAVALDRNPGNLNSRDPDVVARAIEEAEAIIGSACKNVGLPAPDAVWVHRRSLFQGAAPARRFMPFPLEGSGPRRVCVHAEIVFPERVLGPVLLGAGRFFGLGLFKPMSDR